MTVPEGDPVAVAFTRIAELRTLIDGLADRADQLERDRDGMAEVALRVEELSRTVSGAREHGQGRWPRVWRTMSDEEYIEGCRGLAAWVCEILLVRYPHAGDLIPPCWPMHPPAVEYLDVLWWTWEEWTGPEGAAHDALAWHKEILPEVTELVGGMCSVCNSKGVHVRRDDLRRVPPQLRGEDDPDLVVVELLARVPAGEWR